MQDSGCAHGGACLSNFEPMDNKRTRGTTHATCAPGQELQDLRPQAVVSASSRLTEQLVAQESSGAVVRPTSSSRSLPEASIGVARPDIAASGEGQFQGMSAQAEVGAEAGA